jgi:hypothetical protein
VWNNNGLVTFKRHFCANLEFEERIDSPTAKAEYYKRHCDIIKCLVMFGSHHSTSLELEDRFYGLTAKVGFFSC